MRLSPFWVAAVVVTAPFSSLLPASGHPDPAPASAELLKRPLEAADDLKAVEAISTLSPVQNAVAKTVPVQPAIAPSGELEGQTVTPTPIPTDQPTPNSTPNTSPNTSPTPPGLTPITPGAQPTIPGTQAPPSIRPPGTLGAPQQETPNQIQIPINAPSSTPTEVNPPIAPPTNPPLPGNAQPTEAPSLPEPKVLTSEVVVRSEQGELSPELQDQVYSVIRTQPGRTTTRSQLQEDINAIFSTGYFSNVRALPEDTPLGVRVSFIVQPNPILRNVQVQSNVGTNVRSVLPPNVVDQNFRSQYGSILNLNRLSEGIKGITKWYQDNGYVLAQIVGAPQVSPDGTVTLEVAEGVVEDIQVHYRTKEGEDTDAKGRPIRGRTKKYIITRELELRPGQVFNSNTLKRDLNRVYRLGLFEDAQPTFNPGQDPRKVVVVINVSERRSGSIAAGAGVSSASGLFGTLSYQQQNLGGRDQTLGAEVELGQRDLLFDGRFTDPWIAGDPYRTSYTVDAFRRDSLSLIFDNHGKGGTDIFLPNGDNPRVVRTGGGVTFTRPLAKNPFVDSEWTASAGFLYQRVELKDSNGRISSRDSLGNLLSFTPGGRDDLYSFQLGVVRDRRNDLLRPTSGSLFRISDEQTVPLGIGNILFNRIRGSYSQYFPVKLLRFSRKGGPQALAFNLQAGTIIGDLPPYEAFSLGGSNSVRGYDEGVVGSGRSFIQATAEYRFPIISIVGGALFFDVGSDLGTGNSVPGNPAGARGEKGTGFGYGLGVRVQSPLGPIRVDYGFNDLGQSRIHFGIGERF